MINRTRFLDRFSHGIHLLDGATGTMLRKAGMPAGCCAEQWILDHPRPLAALQNAYCEAGSEIIYAPTFLAQPLALAKWNLAAETARINRELVSLSRAAAPGCLVAGNLTTMQGSVDPLQGNASELIRDAYRSQIAALLDGGADLLVAETLMNISEAVTILDLAREMNAPAVMISFACMDDGKLYSGESAADAVYAADRAGAAAVGVNCIAASAALPCLIGKLRAQTKLPLICKPNAGRPVKDLYPVTVPQFTSVMQECISSGSSLIGGCCGTSPEYIAALKKACVLRNCSD